MCKGAATYWSWVAVQEGNRRQGLGTRSRPGPARAPPDPLARADVEAWMRTPNPE